MKPFNLAEAKIAERCYCREHLNRHMRVIAVLVVVSIVVAFGSYVCKESIRNKATQVKSELANVQSKCVVIKRDSARVDARLSRRGWQRQLARGSHKWIRILKSVVGCVPEGVWLNRMGTAEKTSNISVDGQAASLEAMTEFINNLRYDAGFKEVRLTGTKIVGKQAAMCVDFTLDIKMKADTATTTAVNPNQVPQLPTSQ